MIGARRMAALTAPLAGLVVALAAPTPARAQEPSSAPAITVVLRGGAAAGSVEFGKAFELDVVRRWARSAPAPPWSDEVLAPLVVDVLATTTTADGDTTIETRHCRAFAFQLGAATLLPKSETPLTLLVDSCLPAGDAGALELLPPPPLAVRAGQRQLARLLLFALIAAALAGGALLGLRAWHRRQAAPRPRRRLQAEIAVLAATVPTTPAERRAEAIAATRILRQAGDLARQAAAPQPAAFATAAEALLDDVKFAGRTLAADERARLLDALRAAVAAVPEDR
ncbi:MAG: hypothetical protein IPK26_25005 [Planctomycetes bacterium]|nr:hypothetical protein [Planctomycetota bacterium]